MIDNRKWELTNFCELDKFAVKSYCAIYDVDPALNLGDITRVDENSMSEFSMICGGSPCFIEGTLVLTENGYIPIEQVKVGNKVLTHTGKYEEVLDCMTNEAINLMAVYASPSEVIYCTPSHPFYIRRYNRKWDSQNGKYTRVFDDPEWITAENLHENDYVGTVVNNIEELPQWDGYDYYQNQAHKTMIHKNELSKYFNEIDFWYIVGRYMGDGWLKTYDEKSIIICGNSPEIRQITERLDRLNINYCVVHQNTCDRVQIVNKEIYLYLQQFGHGASNKHLTKDILNLPVHLLKSFLEGYVDADGTFTQGRYKISSVSRRLIYEIGQCIVKAYKRPFSIYFISRPKTHQIEGRIVNQRDFYQICWKPSMDKQDHAFYENGYIWSPIRKIEKETSNELVYNLEVEKDHSYIVQNIIVHNCQDFSVAGKQAGSMWKCKNCHEKYNPLTVHFDKRDSCPKCGCKDLDKTRSSLLVEWLRIIRAKKPKWAIYENVKNIVGKKFQKTFQLFIDELHEYGYNTYYQVLNAKDYAIPQNRERLYLLAIRKDLDNKQFKFPEPIDSDIAIKDILEDEVDEKYYVNTPGATEMINELIAEGKLPAVDSDHAGVSK